MKTALLALSLAVVPMFAQDNAMVNLLSKHLKTSKEYTVAVAQQMPPDSYSFKPNAAEMTFAEQMNHIANANAMFTGGKPDKSKKMDKDAVIAGLNASFDSAIASLSSMSDADLHKTVKTEEGEGTVLENMLLMLDHTTHHRAQCIVYLRVKGIKPTDYRF